MFCKYRRMVPGTRIRLTGPRWDEFGLRYRVVVVDYSDQNGYPRFHTDGFLSRFACYEPYYGATIVRGNG